MKMGLPFITAHLVAAIAGVLVRPAGGRVGHARPGVDHQVAVEVGGHL